MRREHETLAFKPPVIKDSTILDMPIFQSEIADFFAQKKKLANLPVLLILPEEKVFIKGFELDLGDLERKEFFRNEFINEIPFESSDLIIHERLVGRVLEFSALHRLFIEDFKSPFLNQKMPVLGAISVPQIMAMDLHPKEKSFLLAFYDNDFILALAENSSIIFSETHELKGGDIMEAMRAFDHFVQHLKAADIKSVSIILGEDKIEEALKAELERREYVIKEIKKINVLDMIADYYNSHKNELNEWNLIRVKESPAMNFWRRYKNPFLAMLILLFIGAAGWGVFGKLQPSAGGLDTIPAETITEESQLPPAEEVSAVVPAKKSDFPVQILNGTKLAGEAGNLRTVLIERGFIVSKIGNNKDQDQVVTTIFTGSDVPDEIVGDLRLILENRYQEILVSSSPVMTKDIQVVIGRKKQE